MFQGVTFTKVWQQLMENLFHREDSVLPSFLVLLKRKYWEYKDYELGREHMGMDKYGNEYYQYYSHIGGLPTRRIVVYKFYEGQKFHNDPHFIGWLQYRIDRPPTPEELQLLYLEDSQRKRKALAWDTEQSVMLENAKAKAEKLTEKAKAKVVDSSQESMAGLLEEEKVYKYAVEPKPIAAVSEKTEPEHEVDLKVLKTIIRNEERKIQEYKDKKEESKKYMESAVKELNRYDKFKEKFKDVFLELEMGESKNKYALIEKDPDIVYTLKNLQ
eukprot:TRINITY_DN2340_c0_g1_i1.p4 TRINITY_DN2340_c0_g1~~TRINITY_DN2340_c0_g1_i1.p4  ORF type:complete len:272 (-),score=48.56 TRINITY_DN2340_c0_g1_i1:4786-5601(-)